MQETASWNLEILRKKVRNARCTLKIVKENNQNYKFISVQEKKDRIAILKLAIARNNRLPYNFYTILFS